MASIAPLLLAALVHTLGEAGVVLGFEAPWALPWLVLVPYLSALATRRAVTRGRFSAADRLTRLVRLSGALAFGVAVLGLGWIETVRDLTGARLDALGWPEPALFVALAPFVVLQVCALHAETTLHTAPGVARRRALVFQLRGFALVAAPVVLYLALACGAGAHPALRAWLEHVGLVRGVFVSVVAVLVALLLPALLRRLWDTRPLADGPARRLLEVVGRRARFSPSEWLVWRADGATANAAVVGFVPWGRLVLFTEDLLGMLGPRELAAVVGHEIGHAKRWHGWMLLTWALVAVLLGSHAVEAALDVSEVLGAPAFAALVALAAAGFGFLSRRLELDADLYCADLTGDGAALASALRLVDGGYDRDGWRHFSSARRVAFLAEALALPGRARRFKRRVAAFGATGAVLAAGLLAFELVQVARDLPRERIDAAIALGRYDEASTLVARLDRADYPAEDFADLALALGVARELGEGATVGAFEAALDGELAADASAGRGDVSRAWALAALGAARGGRELETVALTLGALREGKVERAGEALESVDERWRARLDPLVARSRDDG